MEKMLAIRVINDEGTTIYYLPENTPLEDIQKLPLPQSTIDAYAIALASRSDFNTLPNWATWTDVEAETNISNAIFNGQDVVTIKANIAAQLTDITTANVSQINARLTIIRILFGNAVDAIIAIREILVAMAKAIIYLRNLVVKL